MKTKITKADFLALALARHPKGTKTGMKHDEYMAVVIEAAFNAMEMYAVQESKKAFEAGRKTKPSFDDQEYVYDTFENYINK